MYVLIKKYAGETRGRISVVEAVEGDVVGRARLESERKMTGRDEVLRKAASHGLNKSADGPR